MSFERDLDPKRNSLPAPEERTGAGLPKQNLLKQQTKAR
jgi:hypothetical protein